MADSVFTVISSDGHAGALMADYRPYVDPEFHAEFDAFLVDWNEKGSRNFDAASLGARLDPEYVDEWTEKMVDTGRIDGFPDVHRRIAEMEREGVCVEVLFPDFGLPFELYSPTLAAAKGMPAMDEVHRRAGFRAFNRWLVDFVSGAPGRFIPMAAVSWSYDVDDAVAEIRWAREHGFRGIVLPHFDPLKPLYHPEFEPIWNVLDELDMIVNSHAALSSTSTRPIHTPAVPHPACGSRLYVPEMMFYTHNVLNHLIWGGVLERHPNLKVVFTEQGSGWVVPMLRDMDYSYDGSYFRTDYRDVIKCKPSEYYERQCYLGSSIFSRSEIRARNDIGVDKMMLGMDFPHHEGTLLETTQEYLRATLGAEHVPVDEARELLGGNAAKVFDIDLRSLLPIARRIGLSTEDVLTPPESDLFPRGDVHKPVFIG
ncbi:amidohydrolase [Nocardia sp. CA2R105]|uniref:amidohydrolase family protein n=1 Tax=Nocardia coffeae TaxID=2873381 RepID=UPI001CA70F57|nr:amidohydrolase family protein [Nocardia coffeae]MBY8862933.1 amidohydrolase [Nocardia coffeae]